MTIFKDTPLATKQTETFLAHFLESCLPKPTTVDLPTPISLCAWRLESPPRACLFSGSAEIDPSTFTAPHLLTKTLLEDRSKRPTPSAIHLVQPKQDEEAVFRDSLLHFAQTALLMHREPISLTKKSPGQTQHPLDTTLEEAISCLISPPKSQNHTLTTLNKSSPWQRDHIDHR